MKTEDERLGQLGYRVYREEMGKKEKDGRKIPKWGECHKDVQDAWILVALEIKDWVINNTDWDDAPDDDSDNSDPDAISSTLIQQPLPDVRSDERDETSAG